MIICQDTVNHAVFTYFPHLPKELRISIWEFAVASDDVPRVITLHYRSGQLARVSIPTGNLEVTCRESYDVYKKFKHNIFVFHETVWKYVDVGNGEILAIQRRGKEHTFPVNFDRDFFLITGSTPPDLIPKPWYAQSTIFDTVDTNAFSQSPRVGYRRRQPFVRQLKRIILAKEQCRNLTDIFSDSSELVELQEVWVFLRGEETELYPNLALRFQHQCPVHHHDVFPSQFCHIEDWQSWTQGRQICPACAWENSNWDCIDGAAFKSRYHNFRITYDASLPKYPRFRDIFRAQIPVIRWVKSKKGSEDVSGNLDIELDPVVSAAAACLSGAGAGKCPH